MTGQTVILLLKIAVSAVTVLLVTSLIVLARGNRRLHGRINIAFFVLTVTALIAFELIIRVFQPSIFDYIEAAPEIRKALNVHLCFAIPSALLMPVMLYTGLTGKRQIHLTLAWVFGALWIGTFVTGVFTLPHSA